MNGTDETIAGITVPPDQPLAITIPAIVPPAYFDDSKEVLGKGVYATVYRYQNFAWKVASDPRTCDSLITEAAVLRRCAHPYIIPLENVFMREESNILQLTLSGYSLSYFTRHNILNVTQRKAILAQLLTVTDYCHERNVLHGDFQPTNMLLSTDNAYPEWDVKRYKLQLIDFGIAVVSEVSRDWEQERLMLHYRAPEMLYGGPYQKASNIWAIGVIFYYMFTERKLFVADDQAGMRKAFEMHFVADLEAYAEYPIKYTSNPTAPKLVTKAWWYQEMPAGASLLAKMLQMAPHKERPHENVY